MIAYFPEIYPEELAYSLYARYFAHTGYPGYVNALSDLMESSSSRVHIETCGKLNDETRELIEKTCGLRQFIEEHTLFPQYMRFGVTAEKRREVLNGMILGDEKVHNLLRLTTSKGDRYFRYCPYCVAEDREKYGETYWHRGWFLNGVEVCIKHGCRLCNTDILIHSKSSPRLYVAEDVVDEKPAEVVNNKTELDFARYIYQVFHLHLPDTDTVPIHLFLTSKLEGTRYISARGKRKYMEKLLKDMLEFYGDLHCNSLTEVHQLEKIFSGKCKNHLQICQVAFFMGITSDELANPVIPEKSQTERFNQKVSEMYKEGLGCHRIAKRVGCSPKCASTANRVKQGKERKHDIRKGIHNQDWGKMDIESSEKVRKICDDIYNGINDSGRPHRVTETGVTKAMGWPVKRLDYLPNCKAIVKSYFESQEQYWAREVEWAWKGLCKEKDPEDITWRNIRDLTNIRKQDFKNSSRYIQYDILAELAEKM